MPYSATVLRSPAAIADLQASVEQLMPVRDATAEPRFFLAAVSAAWRPCVVVVRRGADVAGIVYAKERRCAGVPTGLLCLDARLGTMVIAGADDREQVLSAALSALFAMRRVVELRLLAPPDGFEARVAANTSSALDFEIGCGTVEAHTRLPLAPDYEQFVERLGYKTRRNFRYYRRRFEDEGHTYHPQVSLSEMRAAVAALRSKCRIPSARSEIRRAVDVASAVDHPWIVGLTHRNGEWLSVAAGWHDANRATMFFQLNNDREHAEASLSVVLRARLIETLIAGGTRELLFWSGSAPPLSRYTTPIPAVAYHLDSSTPVWRLARFVIRMAGRHLATWMDSDLRGAGAPAIANAAADRAKVSAA